MSILLKRIIEQQGSGQFYDLNKDFSNFRKWMDGTDEQIKQKFEQSIGSKLNGKRIVANASRGYKQFVKKYEFDVSKISIDDYYDNYVVVAYDNTTPKPKEYFLKPGFKIQVLGPASGQPSPQMGVSPPKKELTPDPDSSNPPQPKENPDAAQHQSMAQAPAGRTPSETSSVKEDNKSGRGHFDAYSIEQIGQDIKPWLSRLLIKPETPLRDFVKGLGWMKNFGRGKSIALYDIVIPVNSLNRKLTPDDFRKVVDSTSKRGGTIEIIYNIDQIKPNNTNDEWNIRIRKSMKDTTAI